MRDSAKGGGKAGMLLNVGSAVCHIPAVNSWGHSSVSALHYPLTQAPRVGRRRRSVNLSEASQILMKKKMIIKKMALDLYISLRLNC